MLAGRVVEHPDVIEHILARFVPCPTGPMPDPLALEQIEEALGHRSVVAVAAPICPGDRSGRLAQIFETRRPDLAGEPRMRQTYARHKHPIGCDRML